MIFYSSEFIYGIDFIITLTAKDTTVTNHDTKEGLFAIRVTDFLTEKYGTGRYLSSNVDEIEAQVWGTRAKWIRLGGEKMGKGLGAGSAAASIFAGLVFGYKLQRSFIYLKCIIRRKIRCDIILIIEDICIRLIKF